MRAYPATSSGRAAALYSGSVGEKSSNALAIEYARIAPASIIDATPRGQFLANAQVDEAIKSSAKRILQSQGVPDRLAKEIVGAFLYGDANAPAYSPASIQNCLWCEASRDFASSLRGDVKVIAVNANPQRVFAQVEVPTALRNPAVRSLGGVPVELLRETYARHGVEGVLPQVQASYVREASLAGLLSTPAAAPVAGVRRAPGATFHVGQVATKALGAATTVYDGVASVREAMQLSDRGNDIGAQSHIVGAVARNVGGWGGAALGASTGAALTAETGPGAFLGGAIGGIAVAVAGDRLAAWIDRHRINHQTDERGHRWAFDPAHPAQGWTRRVDGELDAQATVDRGVPIYTSRTLTAAPELADRLNYQASSRAVELALASPPAPVNPYRVASTPEDHRPANVYEGDWQRDARSGRWSRQVTDSHVGLSMQRFGVEIASRERAAALDRQAQDIVAANLETTPIAIATQYKTAYDRFGWSRHGDLPPAVQDAIQHPGRLLASDGHAYTRGDDGRWTTPGALFGRNPAEVGLQHQLDVAYERLQRPSAAADDESTASGSSDSGNGASIGALVPKRGASIDNVVVAHRFIGPAGRGVGRGGDVRAAESASARDRRVSPLHEAHDASGLPEGFPIFDAAEHHRLFREAMNRHREEQAEAVERAREARDERRHENDRVIDERARADRARVHEERYWEDREASERERRHDDERFAPGPPDEHGLRGENEAARSAHSATHSPPFAHDDAWRHASHLEREHDGIESSPSADRSWDNTPPWQNAHTSGHDPLMHDARNAETSHDPSTIHDAWFMSLDTPRWDDAREAESIVFHRDTSDSHGRGRTYEDPFPTPMHYLVGPPAPDPYANLDPSDPFSYNPYLPGMPEEDKDMADMWLALQSNDTQAIDKAFDKLGERPEVQQLLQEAADIIERERVELAAQREAELAEQRRIDEMIRAQQEAESLQHGPRGKVLTLDLQPLTAADMGGAFGGGDGGG